MGGSQAGEPLPPGAAAVLTTGGRQGAGAEEEYEALSIKRAAKICREWGQEEGWKLPSTTHLSLLFKEEKKVCQYCSLRYIWIQVIREAKTA